MSNTAVVEWYWGDDVARLRDISMVEVDIEVAAK